MEIYERVRRAVHVEGRSWRARVEGGKTIRLPSVGSRRLFLIIIPQPPRQQVVSDPDAIISVLWFREIVHLR